MKTAKIGLTTAPNDDFYFKVEIDDLQAIGMTINECVHKIIGHKPSEPEMKEIVNLAVDIYSKSKD